MRLLHTSDWHLGATTAGASVEEEQRRFLDWLVERIEAERVDALLISGDIFHYPQPSAAALRDYYGFLVDCARQTNLRQVVVTGGNHDSPSRLDAPREVLEALDVQVVGGIRADEDSWQRCLCPIARDDGEVELVVAAVPYVQESKLGIVTTGLSATELKTAYQAGFRRLYRHLADTAAQRWPAAELVAMGHLTCYGPRDAFRQGDFHTELHQMAAIHGLSPTIFDRRWRYVALGHIHRGFRVTPVPGSSPQIWYSGTPVATARDECTPRYVSLVDVQAGQPASVDRVEVPRFRPVFDWSGDEATIAHKIESLQVGGDLSPYLYVELEVETPEAIHSAWKRLEALLDERFAEGGRPRIIQKRERITTDVGPVVSDAERFDALSELSPEDVFRAIHRQKHGCDPSDDLLALFRELVVDEDVDQAGRDEAASEVDESYERAS